jgi:hypothetical protein
MEKAVFRRRKTAGGINSTIFFHHHIVAFCLPQRERSYYCLFQQNYEQLIFIDQKYYTFAEILKNK